MGMGREVAVRIPPTLSQLSIVGVPQPPHPADLTLQKVPDPSGRPGAQAPKSSVLLPGNSSDSKALPSEDDTLQVVFSEPTGRGTQHLK